MRNTDTVIDISIVVPAYNEEKNLGHLYINLLNFLKNETSSFEIIFVDDGSKDGTWGEILRLHAADGRVDGLRFSRNFGHQNALWAGILSSKGRAVITMDADMQHPPEVIPELIKKWKEGYKIINTIKADKGNSSLFKTVGTVLGYKMISVFADIKLEYGMADFRLLDRQVVDELIKFKEDNIFLRGLTQWVGYRQTKVPYKCGKRHSGVPKYTFLMLAKLVYLGLTGFSFVPLRLGFMLGGILCPLSLAGIIFGVFTRFVSHKTDAIMITAVSFITFLLGLIFILLGILGEYLGKVLVEVRSRPRYIVSEVTR